MTLSMHELTEDPKEVFLSYEDGLPTLWDFDGPRHIRAVWLEGKRDGKTIIEVTTDEDIVSELLGVDEED